MDGRRARIAPSVLPADFAALGEECRALEKAGADRIQWDVMDGRFVPNLTFGPDVVAAVRPHTALPFEAHLMVVEPDALVEEWSKPAASWSSCTPRRASTSTAPWARSVSCGARSGVALNPATPLTAVEHVLDIVDLLLVMTVNPGFGGQPYLASMEPKIAEAARRLIGRSGQRIELEVDGGIGPATIGGAAHAGADVFCAGSALYRHPDGLAAAVAELRECAEEAWR